MSKKSTCIRSIITATKWLPVLVTASIFTWGWYAYTFKLTLLSVDSLVQQIICLVIFHILYVFSFWSYLQTIFTPFGKIPNKFYLPPEICEDLARAPSEQHRDEILAYVVKRNDLPIACRTYLGGIRFCEKCNLIKPDRCHHCSICGICILRMDHHCPWINNCVSFTNYKFFVLFLGYTFALCIFVATTTFPCFLKFWSAQEMSLKFPMPGTVPDFNQTIPIGNMNSNNLVPFGVKFHILFLFFVSTMLSIGVMFLFCYHIHLLLNNRSTLESFRPPLMTYGPDRNAFNLEGSGLTYDQRPQLGPCDEEVRQELLNPLATKSMATGNLSNNDTRV